MLSPCDRIDTDHGGDDARRTEARTLIDRNLTPNYSDVMDSLEQANADLERLESQLQQLLDKIKRLREENESLQARQESLVTERATLVAKNDEARTKVEAMIHRLKALEQI
jgi:cell division protein ZapB